jgi:hypothetical protein
MLEKKRIPLAVIVTLLIAVVTVPSCKAPTPIKPEKEPATHSSSSGIQTLLTGLGFGESPR